MTKKMTMKRLLIMLIVVLFCVLSPMSSLSGMAMVEVSGESEDIGIMPFWINIFTVSLSPGISGSNFNVGASVVGYDGVKRIDYTVYLQKKSSSGTWSDTGDSSPAGKNDSKLNSSHTFKLTTRGTYRARIYGTVQTSSGTESFYSYSGELTY